MNAISAWIPVPTPLVMAKLVTAILAWCVVVGWLRRWPDTRNWPTSIRASSDVSTENEMDQDAFSRMALIENVTSMEGKTANRVSLIALAAQQIIDLPGVAGVRGWKFKPDSGDYLLCAIQGDEGLEIELGHRTDSIKIPQDIFELALAEKRPQQLERFGQDPTAPASHSVPTGEYFAYPINGEKNTPEALIEVFVRSEVSALASKPIVTIVQTVRVGFDRINAERNLIAAEERFRTSTAGAWDWDMRTDNVIFSSGFLKMIQRTSEDFPPNRQSFLDILHPDDDKMVWHNVDQHIQHDLPYDHQLRLLVAGEYRWFRTFGQVRKASDGTPVRMSGAIQDIQRLKDAESEAIQLNESIRQGTKQLEKSHAELDEFVYVASHDLRAPLRGIESLAKMIEADEAETLSEPSQKKLHLLRSRIGRMNRLLDDLLAYSRAGRTPGDGEFVSMRELINEAAETVAIPDHITFEIQGDLPTLRLDPIPVSQIFRNLIDNAIKHHHRDRGTITVRCQDQPDWFDFCITDDGPGIDAKFHQKIFLIFETLAPRDRVEGSGMGLALANKLAVHLGGQLRVESTLGEGSTFIVGLPKSHYGDASSTKTEHSVTAPPSGSPRELP